MGHNLDRCVENYSLSPDAESTASPSSPPSFRKSPGGVSRDSGELSAGTGVGHLRILSATPRWDGHVPRGPVSISFLVAGLIGVAEVEIDDSSRDEYPNCWGMPVSGAPSEFHDELRDAAEECMEIACDGGRRAVDEANGRMVAVIRAEVA